MLSQALITVTVAIAHAAMASTACSADIEGRWITFDGSTNIKRSIVEITRERGRITGRIVELFTTADEDPDPTCDLCVGIDRGRKIRGMPILSLESTSNERSFNGTILDPEEGRVYRCAVTLDALGKQLSIRCYVVVALFGRTQTWIRTE